jgi:hypothetical protein
LIRLNIIQHRRIDDMYLLCRLYLLIQPQNELLHDLVAKPLIFDLWHRSECGALPLDRTIKAMVHDAIRNVHLLNAYLRGLPLSSREDESDAAQAIRDHRAHELAQLWWAALRPHYVADDELHGKVQQLHNRPKPLPLIEAEYNDSYALQH